MSLYQIDNHDPADLVDPREAAEALPHSLEAEQAILGALIFENSVLADVDGLVNADTFHEPFHGRLYAAIYEIVGAGVLAEPTRLAHRFETDPAFVEFGGFAYLIDLMDKAPPRANAPDFARLIRETWQRRSCVALAQELMRRARVDRSVDSLTLIDEAEKGLLQIQMTSRATALVHAEAAVARVIEEFENPSVSAGVSLGLGPLDEQTGGLGPGEMWLIAGRPSMGKSGLVSSAALNVAREGLHPDGRRLGWIEINGEMTVPQMMRRHITDRAFDLVGLQGPAYSSIRQRDVSALERKALYAAAEEIRGLKTLAMVKRTGMTIGNLRSMIRRQVAAWDREGIALGGVSVDHGGLIRMDDARHGRTQEQTQIAIGMKELADELGVPLVVLLQLNRNVEARDDKRPQLADLRDSGAWEENADGVIGVYRDAYYAQRETQPKTSEGRALWDHRKGSRELEAILLKIREGHAGTVKLWADVARNAFRGSAPDDLYGGRTIGMGFGAGYEATAASYGVESGSGPEAGPAPAANPSGAAVAGIPTTDPTPGSGAFDAAEFA